MSLFDTEELKVCQKCKGLGIVYDERIGTDRACSCQIPPPGETMPVALIFDAQQAEQLGEEGMAQALRAARVQEWRVIADNWVMSLIAGTEFSADDLVTTVGLPDLPEQGQDRNNVLGGWFNNKARQDAIVWTGRFVKSERPEGHGNLQRVWRKT